MNSLENLRAQIDELDTELISILAKRMKICLKVRGLKKHTVDESREEEVKNLWRSESEKLGISVPFSAEILASILQESKRLQDNTSEIA